MALKVLESQRPTPLRASVDEWLAEVRLQRSPRTLLAYEWPVKRLLVPFLEADGINDPADIDKGLMDRLSESLKQKGLSPSSLASYLRQVNVYLRWAAKTEGRDKP